MADFGDIADAIALRFLGTTAPSGQPDIKSSTADLPEGIGATPCFLVGMPDDRWEAGMANRRGILRFTCHLVIDTATAALTARALMDWRTALYQRLDGAVQLGGTVAGVAGAYVERTAPGRLRVGDAEWNVIEVTVVVVISEAHNAVA